MTLIALHLEIIFTWPVNAPGVPKLLRPAIRQTFPNSHVYDFCHEESHQAETVTHCLGMYESKPHAVYVTYKATYETVPGAVSTQSSQAKFLFPVNMSLLERFFAEAQRSSDPTNIPDPVPVDRPAPSPEDFRSYRDRKGTNDGL